MIILYLYKITNKINQKTYIGITNNYKKRWANHGTENSVISAAIRKYGRDSFTFEVLYSNISIEEIDQLEIDMIKKYDCLVPKGYNVAKGGRYNTGLSQKIGHENNNACLTYEEAKYIKDHRNLPMYVLYEKYCEKIGYDAFKKNYKDQTYKEIIPTVEQYPYNLEFSLQFSTTGKLEYDEVVDLRKAYQDKIYWRELYIKYADKYDERTFWQIYNGERYKLVMPEVFTEENKQFQRSLSKCGERNSNSKLTVEDVRRIRQLSKEGMDIRNIHELYPQVTTTSIRNIVNRKTWANIL